MNLSHINIRPFQPDDEKALVELWRACNLVRSVNNPQRDIQRKLRVHPEWFLVGILDGQIVASVMAGYEGHRGWLNYVAVNPKFQRRGFGRAIIAEAERLLSKAGCPKVNLQVRGANSAAIDFYRAIGFAIDEVVSMGKRLEHDDKP